jgi:hypothetical protein
MDLFRETLQRAPAVQQLQQGCSRLGLHADVALELVCFLHLQRRYVPRYGTKEPRSLSPGTRLDQLWHWMLLNTQVSSRGQFIGRSCGVSGSAICSEPY